MNTGAGAAQVTPLWSRDEIHKKTHDLAGRIASLAPGPLTLIAIAEGGLPFTELLEKALMRHGTICATGSIGLSSYAEATMSSGAITLTRALDADVTAKDVILVDDILETGLTLSYAVACLEAAGANSVRTCVLLDKPVTGRSREADFKGFDCPDVFVVGFGLDLAGKYRDLPYIGQLTES